MSIGKNMAIGAASGVLGALAMGVVMVASKRSGKVHEPPPLIIEREVEARLGVDDKTSDRQEYALATVEHLLIGAVFGAGYGAARTIFGPLGLWSGLAYGLGVYAINYAGIGPALDLLAGPWDEKPATVLRRITMHLIFGGVTALTTERLLDEN